MSAAFDVVFGVFVAAILALGVVAIRWALRRDRVARARQADRDQTPDTNTRAPAAGTSAGAGTSDDSAGIPASPGAEQGAS